MRTPPHHRSLWLLAVAIVCGVGTWSYTDRVLIPHQVADAGVHDRPRGNLSDLYPRWIGAKDLLLYGRDPYGADVTREIQIGYYGRPLDASRPNDPVDEQGFAYPVYVVFGLAPTIRLPFAVVQRSFFWILVLVTAASSAVWLWLLRRPVRWSEEWPEQLIPVALTLGNVAVMQGLKLQQISLLVAALIAIAVMLLVSDYGVAVGAILAVATIKPQLMVLLLGWLALWTVADWRRRYRLAVSFVATMVILFAASEWYLPHWITRFWHAVIEYQRYTGAMSVLGKAVGRPGSWLLEIAALAVLAGACWKERRAAADSGAFAFTTGLVLATTVLVIPTYAPYNQVLLMPALLLLFRDRRMIWQRSMANRVLLVIVTGLFVWPSISSAVLAALSYILPFRTVDAAWTVPLRMLTQIPVGVAALMLIHYYQMTFNKPARPGAS